MKRHLRGKDVRRLRRNHPFAAIMGMIRRMARHGAAALHALLVLRHRGHTVRKLQTHKASDRHYDKQSFLHSLLNAM